MQLKTFTNGLDAVSEWTGRIVLWLIIPLTLLVVYEVVSTKFFDRPHIWAPEIISYTYAAHFMLAAAYTLLYKGHVSIDIIYLKFSARTRGILDVFTYIIFFFPFVIIILVQGIVYAQLSWSMHETTGSAALPIVPEVKTIIPLTAVLLLIQGLSNFLKSIVQVIQGRDI